MSVRTCPKRLSKETHWNEQDVGSPGLLTAHTLTARESPEQNCVLVLVEITQEVEC